MTPTKHDHGSTHARRRLSPPGSEVRSAQVESTAVVPNLAMDFDMHVMKAGGPPGSGASGPRRSLRMTVSRVSSCSVITLRGEVDATSARDISGLVTDHLEGCRHLLLDLSRLDFFGTEGISALHKINAECTQRGIPWSMVAAGRVSHMLQICDPADALPRVESTAAGLAAMHRSGHLTQG